MVLGGKIMMGTRLSYNKSGPARDRYNTYNKYTSDVLIGRTRTVSANYTHVKTHLKWKNMSKSETGGDDETIILS